MSNPFRPTLIKPPAVTDLTTPPTYTDIYNETVGTQGDIPKLFDPALGDAGKLLDLFAADGSLTGPDPDLTSAQERFGSMNTVQLDAHIAAYEATGPAGQGIVSEAQGITAPTPGTVPGWVAEVGAVTVGGGGGGGAQVPGQVTAGDPAFVFKVIMGAPGPQSFRPSGATLTTKTNIFTGVSFDSAVWQASRNIPGQSVSGPGWVVTLNLNINPVQAGVFTDWIEINAYNPVFGNKYLHPVQLEIRPKPA